MKSKVRQIIAALEKLLLDWSRHPDRWEVAEIDKATSALKRLQEIEHAEQEPTDQNTIVTHYVPRADTDCQKEEETL